MQSFSVKHLARSMSITSRLFKGNVRDQFVLLFQALNQIFEKIMALDIDERHLLRLGHGEEMLETEKDFSR